MDKDETYCRHCEDFYQVSNQTMVDYHSSMACRPDYFEVGIKDSPKKEGAIKRPSNPPRIPTKPGVSGTPKLR